MTGRASVLFVCVKNGGKSQMAAGMMRKIAGHTVDVESAGTAPGDKVNALSAQALLEIGVDITDQHPQQFTDAVIADADRVVVLGRRPCQIRPTEHRSSSGTPMNPPNVASKASNECGSYATTSTAESKGSHRRYLRPDDALPLHPPNADSVCRPSSSTSRQPIRAEHTRGAIQTRRGGAAQP